jgi:hypothetical protein
VASIRTRSRKDGTSYTSVLYVHRGRQTSSSFNDQAEALRFQDVVNRLGPDEALRIWQTADRQPSYSRHRHSRLGNHRRR